MQFQLHITIAYECWYSNLRIWQACSILEKYAIHSSPITFAYDIKVQYEHIVSKYYLQKVILISSSDAHLFSHTYNSCVTWSL